MQIVILLRIFIFFLVIADKVRYNVWFTDVNQKTVSYYDWTLQFSKSTITFAQIPNFIKSINWVKLDVKLSSLVIVTTTHHWVSWWHLLTSIWVIWVVRRNYEIVHLFSEHLFAGSVFNVTTSGTSSILIIIWILVISFAAIFNTKICVAVKFSSSRTIFIPL